MVSLAIAILVRRFFFFQAEDGIRDLIVTGVQTCALPISAWTHTRSPWRRQSPVQSRPEKLKNEAAGSKTFEVGLRDSSLRAIQWIVKAAPNNSMESTRPAAGKRIPDAI